MKQTNIPYIQNYNLIKKQMINKKETKESFILLKEKNLIKSN